MKHRNDTDSAEYYVYIACRNYLDNRVHNPYQEFISSLTLADNLFSFKEESVIIASQVLGGEDDG